MRGSLLAMALLLGGCGGETFDIAPIDDADVGALETSVTDPDTGLTVDPDTGTDTFVEPEDTAIAPDADAIAEAAADTSADSEASVDAAADAMSCDVAVSCYTDRDDDGFAPAGAVETRACSCPKGTTTKSPLVTVDCNDEDPRVHPGATAFYTDPYCVPGTGCTTKSFDYNCNEAEDKQYGVFTACNSSCMGVGYGGAVGCGVAANLTVCKYELLCAKNVSSVKQGCR